MGFVIWSEICIFWALSGLITLNFGLCKWDVNSLSKLLLLLEKKSRWLLKQFIPHNSRIALWRCLSSLLRTEGSLESSFVESLEMPNESLWAEVLFLAVWVEKNEGQDSKMRRQCLPQASDGVVQLTVCRRDSAQWNNQSCCSCFPASLLQEEKSSVLWPKCQHPYWHSPCE